MAVTQSDIAGLMKGIAPVLRDQIADTIQPLADLIVEQGKKLAEQSARIADLERQKGYESLGHDAAGKPRIRLLLDNGGSDAAH